MVWVQRAPVSHRWSARERVPARMDIDGGEASQAVAALAGVEAHAAARIAAVAHGG